LRGALVDCHQLPKKRPEYRQNRKHVDFLQPLSRSISSLSALEEGLHSQLETLYDVQKVSLLEVEALAQSIEMTVPDFSPRTKLEVV
jgi:hypothetical protein